MFALCFALFYGIETCLDCTGRSTLLLSHRCGCFLLQTNDCCTGSPNACLTDLDVIMVPAFLHAASMQCMAASTCEHQVTNIETGQTETEAGFTSLHNLFMHSLSHKHIPFGKVMVPTGLDNLGRCVRGLLLCPCISHTLAQQY